MNRSDKKKKIKEWKDKQDDDFLASLPFPEKLFRELFDFLDDYLERNGCDHTYQGTSQFLASRGISIDAHREFFLDHGGGCDCEILYNVEESFPEEDVRPVKVDVIKKNKASVPKKWMPVPAEMTAIDDLIIGKVPPPWKIYSKGKKFRIQFAKNQEIVVTFEKVFSDAEWNDDDFIQKKWKKMHDREVNSGREIIRKKKDRYETVVFHAKDWVPVSVWVKYDGKQTMLLFQTEIQRVNGDMKEFEKLLAVIS